MVTSRAAARLWWQRPGVQTLGVALIAFAATATVLYVQNGGSATTDAAAHSGSLTRQPTRGFMLPNGMRATAQAPGLVLPANLRTAADSSQVAPAQIPFAASLARPSLAIDRVPRAINPAEGWFERIARKQYSDGQMIGVTLSTPPGYEALYGVRRGDLVTAIDGQPLSDPDVYQALLMHAGKSVTLTINRDGVILDQTVNFAN